MQRKVRRKKASLKKRKAVSRKRLKPAKREVKLTGLRGLAERKRRARKIGKINNSALYAGSPMYFYCRFCGLESDVLPESYSGITPRRVCDECQGLVTQGLLS